MPIYEYKCAKCGVVEVMQGIKEASLKKCPNCKSKVERMISSSSFVLKGSGWYATDYAKKSTPPPADTSSSSNGTNGTASASDGAKPTEKSASASESKPAASSEKSSSAKPASTAKSD
jgi:putative FmdB family regulatory protein